MQIVMEAGKLAEAFLADWRKERREAFASAKGDLAEFSEEAVKRFKDSQLKPLVKRAMSLEVLDERIEAIQSEIQAVWNSALPYEEKVRQVATKKTEISLLQAGQFEFAKAGFHRAA